MRSTSVVLLTLLAAFLVASVGTSWAAETKKLKHQGIERRYLVHNAEAAAGAPAPLVVLLHGYRSKDEVLAAGDDLSYLARDDLNELAAREGFVVAYPAAWRGQWHLFDGVLDTTLEDGRTVDDEGFILATIDHLVEQGVADLEGIYLTGFSDGAIMSYKLLCLPETPFAAAAVGGGSMAQLHRDSCRATRPPPLMVIAGTNDLILPYDGWIFRLGREVSIPETMEHFRLLHGCDGQDSELREDRNKDDDSRVREVRWTGCTRDGAVVLLRVEGGGHTWPSYAPVSDGWLKKAGGHNQDIESFEEIWRFLKRFTKSDQDG